MTILNPGSRLAARSQSGAGCSRCRCSDSLLHREARLPGFISDSATDPKYAGVRRDAVELHLQWHEEGDFKNDGSDPPIIRFIVDDPDALFEEFKAGNVLEPKTKVRDTPWGTREFGFHEP
ncbi:MAG TPA: hypothetical protein VIT18_10730, partial [Terrimicrobiaceae bacterium]